MPSGWMGGGERQPSASDVHRAHQRRSGGAKAGWRARHTHMRMHAQNLPGNSRKIQWSIVLYRGLSTLLPINNNNNHQQQPTTPCSLRHSGHEVKEGDEVAPERQLEQPGRWPAQALSLEAHSRHHVLAGNHLPQAITSKPVELDQRKKQYLVPYSRVGSLMRN